MKTSSLNDAGESTSLISHVGETRSSLRILHVIYSLSLKHGGPPEGLRQLAEGYRQEGIHLEVASLDDPEEDFLKELPFKVHALGPVKTVYGYSPQLLPWLQAHVGDYDAVVINGIWQYNSLAAWRAVRKRLPYAVFIHGALDPWFKKKYPLKHLKKVLYWRAFQYPVLRDALAVLFTTETERGQALTSFRLNRWNGVVVPYGTNRPSGDPATQKEEFFSACPDVRDRRFLLFMARIHEKKGCDLLIEAFSRISASAPYLHLVMAGPDQVGLKATLEKQGREVGNRRSNSLARTAAEECEMGRFLRHRGIHPSFASGKSQNRRRRSAGMRQACADFRQGQYLAGYRYRWPGIVEEDTANGTYPLVTKWLELSENERTEMSLKASACLRKAVFYERRGKSCWCNVRSGTQCKRQEESK
jgi:glycosyltransferase involved in cell wall biosynthesis